MGTAKVKACGPSPIPTSILHCSLILEITFAFIPDNSTLTITKRPVLQFIADTASSRDCPSMSWTDRWTQACSPLLSLSLLFFLFFSLFNLKTVYCTVFPREDLAGSVTREFSAGSLHNCFVHWQAQDPGISEWL